MNQTWLIVAIAASVACSQTRRFSKADKAQDLNSLLAQYITLSGRVDYEGWKDSPKAVAALDHFLAEKTNKTPDTDPKSFPTVSQQVTYWTNLYNLLVLREVIRHWPLDSVREVKIGATSYLVPGRGFFANTKFRVGGKDISLDDIEHRILRVRYQDARIHFVLNCGANSCPPLPRKLFSPETFGHQLQEATQNFISDPRNVQVDKASKTVRVSKLFDWYRDDFQKHAARHYDDKGRGTIVDFLQIYAKGETASALQLAKENDYNTTFFSYDWGVNDAEGNTKKGNTPPKATSSAALAFPTASGSVWTPQKTKGKVVVIDVWATYCLPCKDILPQLQRLEDKYRSKGLKIIALSVDDDKAIASEFLTKLNVTLELAFDTKQSIFESNLGVSKLPSEILYNREGQVVKVVNGRPDLQKLEATIVELLNQ